jgi:tetrahydromethanopterin S-methyltransferase subunit G
MYNPHVHYQLAKLHHKDLLDEARRQKLIKDSGRSSGIHPGLVLGLILAGVIVIGLVDPVIVFPPDSRLLDLLRSVI